jgi:hypothetical protein
MQPPPSALIGLDACKLPCWNSIVPRETSIDAAQTVLSDAGYALFARKRLFTFDQPDACQVWLNTGAGYVTVISLIRCPGVRLGDLLAILGKPEGILRSATGLTFREGKIIVMVRMLPCDAWFSPRSDILSIYFVNRNPNNVRNQIAFDPVFQAFPWRGFANPEFYHQEDSAFPICA